VDIGSGLGTNVLAALRHGARVIAVDMSDEHLAEIRAKAAALDSDAPGVTAGETAEKRLETRWGRLPDQVPLSPRSVSGILCAQVLHFLNPDGVRASFQRFSECLAPGGVLVVLACGHYQKLCSLIPGKIAAIDAATLRDPAGSHGCVTREEMKPMTEAIRAVLPEELHPAVLKDTTEFQTFSPQHLETVAQAVGLEVEVAEFCDGRLSNYPVFLYEEKVEDRGREQVLLIARKPRL
jgi:SAM-dependent methyltransferase